MSINPSYLRKHLENIVEVNPLAVKQDSAWRLLSHLEELEIWPGQDNALRLADWELGRKFSPQEMADIVLAAQGWLEREAIAQVESAIQEGLRADSPAYEPSHLIW